MPDSVRTESRYPKIYFERLENDVNFYCLVGLNGKKFLVYVTFHIRHAFGLPLGGDTPMHSRI